MNHEVLIKTTNLVKQYPMGENHLTALKNVNLEFKKVSSAAWLAQAVPVKLLC